MAPAEDAERDANQDKPLIDLSKVASEDAPKTPPSAGPVPDRPVDEWPDENPANLDDDDRDRAPPLAVPPAD